MPAGEALPLLGCLASRIDFSVPQNHWSVTVINPCLCYKYKHKCSIIWGEIIAETQSAEGHGLMFSHHIYVHSRSCPGINPDAS